MLRLFGLHFFARKATDGFAFGNGFDHSITSCCAALMIKILYKKRSAAVNSGRATEIAVLHRLTKCGKINFKNDFGRRYP
jgi:hypothetical protein